MYRLIEITGIVSGIVGLLVCLVSGVLRLSGIWVFHGFDLMTLFVAGIGLMVAACFLKLQVAGSERRP